MNPWEAAGREALRSLARAAGAGASSSSLAISSLPRPLATTVVDRLAEHPRQPAIDATGRTRRGDRVFDVDRDRTPEELDDDGLDELPTVDVFTASNAFR